MQSTLVLNASYEPLAIVSATRGVSLVLSGRASSLDDSDRTFNSATTSIPVPWVIRLNHFVKKSATAKPAKFSRRGVMIRDGFSCAYCGKAATTIDHVIPRTYGGKSTYDNCVAACQSCNRKKGHRSVEDLGWTLNMSPKAPSLFASMLGRARNNDEQLKVWGQYIVMFQPDLAPLLESKTLELV